jgi:hypothetical protein
MMPFENRPPKDHFLRSPVSLGGGQPRANRVGLAALLLVLGLDVPGCSRTGSSKMGETAIEDPGTVDTDGTGESDQPSLPSTAELLEAFFAENGGREAFGEPGASALEALLVAEDALDSGDIDAARAQVEGVFLAWPYESDGWYGRAPEGLNIGDPIAYYGLRMVEDIVAAGHFDTTGTIKMTAIVANCATVTRPTLPDLVPETVSLTIAPEILADDGLVLRQSTNLFRHWVRSITRGAEIELNIVEMAGCATVSYTDDGSTIVSYPDTDAMIAGIPTDIARETDVFWVVAPSGVPGDGTGYGRHFITGGMGGAGARPLFLSDDAWFLRKPEHLGTGAYHVIERRAYQPQWFQHEFMHHLFRTYPEFGLEESGHQWFDRETWPSDFEGRFEPDYYSEALDKRLLSAVPSLGSVLVGLDYADMSTLPLSAIGGRYQRLPVENEFHDVMVTVEGDLATWSNEAGVSWALLVRDGVLYTGPDCIYGEVAVDVELETGGLDVVGLWFGGERYSRVD